MKTTIEMSDTVYRQMKARAALRGQTMKAFVMEAIREKLQAESQADSQKGWRDVFGKAPTGSTEEVQAVIDEEFSQIRPEDWQ